MKFGSATPGIYLSHVASFAEAWIEIYIRYNYRACRFIVASFAEAWIEIDFATLQRQIDSVASFAEAWIEIVQRLHNIRTKLCRLLRGGVD